MSTRRQEVAADVWRRGRPLVEERLVLIAAAADALAQGRLADEERARAWTAAQMLAGSLGSFGFTGPSTLAAEIEDVLEDDHTLTRQDAPAILALVRAIRAQLPGDGA